MFESILVRGRGDLCERNRIHAFELYRYILRVLSKNVNVTKNASSPASVHGDGVECHRLRARPIWATQTGIDPEFGKAGRDVRLQIQPRQQEVLEPLEVLALFRWHLSTNPMDKVFPLLGMMRDVGITHEYTAGLEACYKSTARAILESSGTLDLLDFVVSPRAPKNRRFPSWVPDWSEGKSSDDSDMGRTHIERVRLDTCKNTHPTFGGPASLRFEGQDSLVLEGLEIDDILALDKPMSPDWVTIMDAGPPLWEEPAPVRIPLVGSYLSSLVRIAKLIGHGITSVKHEFDYFVNKVTDLRYFDQWVRFYRGVCEKHPEDYSPKDYPDLISQVFSIFRWLSPYLFAESSRAVLCYNRAWKYISKRGWERFTHNLRFFPTVYGIVLGLWFLSPDTWGP